MAKKPEPFNNPFAQVKLKEPASTASAKSAPAAKPYRPEPKRGGGAPDDEAAMFLEAVGEVVAVRHAPTKGPREAPKTVDRAQRAHEDAEALVRLAELVAGEGFELRADGATVRGLDPAVVELLQRGALKIDASGDASTQAMLEPLIQASRVAGHRCVELTAADGARQWLTQGRVARHVLAFVDLGGGRLRVLLRR